MNEKKRELLAIFPLPNFVLFPGIVVPLNIFEPRYVTMIKDVIEGEGEFGIVALKSGWESDYLGNPPAYSVGCKVSLVQEEELPDGRFNVLVRAYEKFRIEKEIPGKPYRRAFVVPLEEREVAGEEKGIELCETLLSRVADCGDRFIDGEQIKELTVLDPSVFINAVSYLSLLDTCSKQFLLEADGVTDRYEKYMQLAEFDRAGYPSRSGPMETGRDERVH